MTCLVEDEVLGLAADNGAHAGVSRCEERLRGTSATGSSAREPMSSSDMQSRGNPTTEPVRGQGRTQEESVKLWGAELPRM